MNRRQRRKGLIAEARTIGEKAQNENRDLSDEEVSRITAIKSEVDELTKQIQADDNARSALKSVVGSEQDDDEGEDDKGTKGRQNDGWTPDKQVVGGEEKSGRLQIKDRDQTPPMSFGEAFTKSEGYKNFQKAFPSGVGEGSRVEIGRTKLGDFKSLMGGTKANLLTTELSHPQAIRYPTLDMIDRPRLTLLDIIGRGEMAGAFEYIQITGVNRGAAIVEEATGATDATTGEDLDPLKPTSDFTTQLADARPYTYADGYDVTNQMLSDAPAFATYLNTELGYSINRVIEEKLLRGSGVNGEPKGLLNTTGVQVQAFDTSMVRTVRKAITKVTRVGGQVTGVLMSPELDEEWDLLQDANGRYYGQGPFGSGPGTAWGRPRIVSELLSGTNTVIVGDFSTMALLDREGLAIEAFTQHKDYAQRNKVYVRAELRAGQVIWRPNRLVNATVAGPAV